MAPVDGEELRAVPADEFSRRGGNRSRRIGVVPEPKMSVPQSVAEIPVRAAAGVAGAVYFGELCREPCDSYVNVGRVECSPTNPRRTIGG